MKFIRPITLSAAALAVTLSAAGCSQGSDTVDAAAPSSASSSVSPRPSASSTPASTPAEPVAESSRAENECLGEMRVGIISMGWELVVASQGAGDHGDMVESFNESVKDAFDSNENSVGPCRGNVELAELQFQSQVLATHVLIEDGTAGNEYYADVVDSGNAWFEAIERDDYEMVDS